MELNLRYIRDYFAETKAKAILVWILQIALTVGLAALISMSFCQTVGMQEGSMDPTFAAGDKILVNKISYKIGSPQRGDIIAFRMGEDSKASTHIKRVIGLPGDIIQIKEEGQILINGETYVEQKNFPSITNAGLAAAEIKLDKDEYFVLGDNRNSSEDSRFVGVGNIKEEAIVGKLWFVISPMNRLGFIRS